MQSSGRKSRLLPLGVYAGTTAKERWAPEVRNLPLEQRVEALEVWFRLKVSPRLSAPGETIREGRPRGPIVGIVRSFSWPASDAMRTWQKGTLHQVVVTVRVGDEAVDKTGKRRRRLDVIGFAG
jgi:hypothetical protein